MSRELNMDDYRVRDRFCDNFNIDYHFKGSKHPQIKIETSPKYQTPQKNSRNRFLSEDTSNPELEIKTSPQTQKKQFKNILQIHQTPSKTVKNSKYSKSRAFLLSPSHNTRKTLRKPFGSTRLLNKTAKKTINSS